MSTAETADYPCPECGFDGPHTRFPASRIYECGNAECYAEFLAEEATDE